MNESSPAPAPAPVRSHYGRRVIFAGFLGNVTSIGMTLYLFSVVLDAMRESFGASVTSMSAAPAIFQVGTALTAVLLGRVLNRLSIRRVMVFGAVWIAIGMLLLSQSRALWQAAFAFGLFVTVGSAMVGTLPASTLVTRFFVARRGRALGWVAAGTTGAGILVALPAARLVEAYDWRGAFLVLGVFTLVVVAPSLWALIVERPEDVGEGPDGAHAEARGGETPPPTPPMPEPPARDILGDPRFWLLTLVFALIFSASSIGLIFAVPFAAQFDIPLTGGAAILALRATSAILGKVVVGSLSDVWGRRNVLAGIILAYLVLWNLLVAAESGTAFVLASCAIAFCSGAALPVENALFAAIFGTAGFAKSIGFRMLFAMPFHLAAPLIAGWVYDSTGDYATAFRAFLPVFVVAGILLYFVREPEELSAPTVQETPTG